MDSEIIPDIETSVVTIYRRALIRRFFLSILQRYSVDYTYAIKIIGNHLALLAKAKAPEASELLKHWNQIKCSRQGEDNWWEVSETWLEVIMNNSDWMDLLETPIRAYLGESLFTLW